MVLTVRYAEMQVRELKVFYNQGHPPGAQSLDALLFAMGKF